MVDLSAQITDSNARKNHDLNLGLISSSSDTKLKRATLLYRVPGESELAGFGMEGFRRRLEERVTNCVGSRGFHMVDQPVDYHGIQAFEIRLNDQAYYEYCELERAAIIEEEASNRVPGRSM